MNKSITASVCLFGDEGESFHWSVRPQILQIVPRCFISRPNRRHQRLRASFLIYTWINDNDERFSEMKHGASGRENKHFTSHLLQTTWKEDDCVCPSQCSQTQSDILTVSSSGGIMSITVTHSAFLKMCCFDLIHSGPLIQPFGFK